MLPLYRNARPYSVYGAFGDTFAAKFTVLGDAIVVRLAALVQLT
ncbi:MAG: hypothetical protein V1934_01065 [Methanobacteriota archaeon]